MKKNPLTIILVISLVLNLLLGIALVLLIPRLGTHTGDTTPPTEVTKEPTAIIPTETTAPSAADPDPTEVSVTQSTETTPPTAQPPATQPPVTQTPQLYTLQQLQHLDNTLITYGPGTAKNGDPAPYAGPAQEKYGEYDAHFIEPDEDVIYLTFDCGYEYFVGDTPVTGMILDTLKQEEVKAVFFVTLSYVEHNPQLVQRMIDEGHIVGNHSADHYSMPSLTIEEMEAQILTLHDYVEAHFGYSMKFFRPPEGSFSIRSLAVTQNLNYETVHWSFAYADWDPQNQPEPSAALDKILSCHHDGAIYLLHAVSETNAAVLADVIDGLRDLGYRLELLS